MYNLPDQSRVERNSSLDLFKGICIIFVIITHYQWADRERLSLLFPFWIDMAVPIFMIISGYLYAKSFERHGIGTVENAYEPKALLQRIIRFTVPFTIAYLVEEVAYVVYYHEITPVKSLYRFLVGGAGPGSYYYPVMIQFIFWFPVIFFLIKRHGEKGFVGCIIINFIYELLQRAYGMNEGCYRMLVFRYTFVIAFGCYMALSKEKLKTWMLVLLGLVGAGYIVIFKYMNLTPPITIYWTGTSYLASMFIVPIAYVLITKARISCKPLEILGKASFNIFLVQMLYYAFAARITYKIISNEPLQILVSIVICILAGIPFFMLENCLTKKFIANINKSILNN